MNAVDFDDTIVAPISGLQRAPVALIRASGELSERIATEIFRPRGPHAAFEPMRVVFGSVMVDEEAFDEGFLTRFESGHSYTGESSFELSCHGSPANVRRIIGAIIALGARPARPGEFTERAFMNGRLDLTQAEAVRETVEASTVAQSRRAARLRQGRLSDSVRRLRERTAGALAKAEAAVDFSDEVGELDRTASIADLEEIRRDIDVLLAGYSAGRITREGLCVAIVGRPNVGKSSLLNALMGMDRAIVTDIPGTTRDTIEESVEIAGFPVVLTDTAGLRDAQDAVEQLGVERSHAAIENADDVWLVYEMNAGWTEKDEDVCGALPQMPSLVLANKADLARCKSSETKAFGLPVSALTGQGLEDIERYIEGRFEANAPEEGTLLNERHREDLEDALGSLQHAVETLSSNLPTDLACVDLYGALHSLGRITGETAPDEVIEKVFRDFCIGK